MEQLEEKRKILLEYLRHLGSVAVAFSGGVDSVFLMKMAQEALGEKAIAVTVDLHSFPEREKIEAEEFCKKEQITQIVVKFDELAVEGFADNPQNRCYLCKRALMSKIKEKAVQAGVQNICEGSNLDDCSDYRPGMQAVQELGILSPLKEVGFTKLEIRILEKEMHLPQWSKPSFACLSSRIPYGECITEEKLHMIEQAEQKMMEWGFRQFRVRMHQQMARIEVLPEDFGKFADETLRMRIHDELKRLGFSYVSADLGGYRTGSLNPEGITKQR